MTPSLAEDGRPRLRWYQQGRRSLEDGRVVFEPKVPEEWCAFDSGPSGERTGPHVGTVVCEGQAWRARSHAAPRRGRRSGARERDAVHESVHLVRGSAFLAVEERFAAALTDAAG